MFFALGRIRKPQDFINIRNTLFEWAGQAARLVYLEQTPATLEKRPLSDADLDRLDILLEQAWQQNGFGGYTREGEATNGICHFALNELHTEARLQVLLVEPEAAPETPLQSPTLYKALGDLQREMPYLEKVYLGFDYTPADVDRLFEVDLKPGVVSGWWDVVFEEETPATPLTADVTQNSQNWLELSVRAESEAVEAITELFARYGYNQGVVIEEAVLPGPDGGVTLDVTAPVTIRTYVSASDVNTETLNKVREGLFYLGKLRHIEELQIAERHEEDWANAWKEFYQVHRVGRRTVIKPPWQEYAAQPDDVIIEIDPGMAFGTGLHPTTRLCLQLMEDRLNPTEHQKVLDLGTGSGILAIAAARLGVPYTYGLDTDPVAVRAAQENVQRNTLSDKIEVAAGSLAIERNETHEGGFYSFSEAAQQPPNKLAELMPFDGIIANIIARILMALAEPMVQSLRPGGLLICSGIIAEKADGVIAALEAAGLTQIERLSENDWVALAGIKAAN